MRTPKKILVVDDDPVIGRSFGRVLSGKDYAVTDAESGEAAIARLGAEDYDLVVTDIRMPGMSGFEVAERVRAEHPRTPVLIMTGYGSDEAEARAKALGVAGFLHKPLSAETIESSVSAALGNPRAAGMTVAPKRAPRPIADEEPLDHGFGARLKNIACSSPPPSSGLPTSPCSRSSGSSCSPT